MTHPTFSNQNLIEHGEGPDIHLKEQIENTAQTEGSLVKTHKKRVFKRNRKSEFTGKPHLL